MPTTFHERITARGRVVTVPVYSATFQEPAKARVRPRPDRYDRFANRYQAQLDAKYVEWTKETQRLLNGAINQGADEAQVRAIINARLEDLRGELSVIGRQRISQSVNLALGKQLEKWVTSPSVQARIASLQSENDARLTDSLIPALDARLVTGVLAAMALTDPTARSEAVGNSILAGRTNVAPYSGGAVVATFEVQREAGRQENIERQARGDKPIPVKWVLDVAAEHCQDDPLRGTHGCPGLARVYEEGWNSLITVPAGNVSCLGNCVLPGNVVIAEAELGFRSPYDGPALELIVVGGRKLTVTPNHPILTEHGFVAAHLLHKGDYVVCGPLGQEVSPSVNKNNHNMPTPIEEIWDALAVIARERGSNITGHATALDFNGDGEFIKGQVDIVRADSLLLGDLDGLAFKHICQEIFNGGSLRQAILSAPSATRQIVYVPGFASYGVMGSGSPELPLLGSSPPHSGEHGLTAIADRGTSLHETPPERQPGHSNVGGQNLDRLPGPISVEQIIEVRNFNYLGHVYDLQTVSGLYNASGVIVHNCRCHLEADFGNGFERVR